VTPEDAGYELWAGIGNAHTVIFGGKVMAGLHGATASAQVEPPVQHGRVLSWLSQVFELNSAGLNWPRGVMILDVLLVPLVIFWAIGDGQYLLSAAFGVLFAALADPGGSYGSRAARVATFGLIGAGLTALAFGIGGDAWGWLALAAFAVTLVSGLAIWFGVHTFATGALLNVWFIIAVAVAVSLHNSPHVTNYTWAQVAAWAGGSALWIAMTFFAWLIRGRNEVPPVIAEMPGDTSRHPLTKPVVMFMLLRAVVIGGTVALAFGLTLSHGAWMPIAAFVAMKPSLADTTLRAVQRLTGAAIGAGAAMLLLLIPANETGLTLLSITHGLEVVALVLFMHATAVRFWSYAFYTAAVAAGVLILLDLLQPTNYSAEGYRVLWTLCGVGIGVIVLLLAGLLAKGKSSAPPRQAKGSA
jgi:hypothetical protein